MGGLLRHDFLHGLLKRWKPFLLVIVIILADSVYMHGYIEAQFQLGRVPAVGSWMDYMLHAFMGMEGFQLKEDSMFVVPIGWLAFYLCLAYIVGHYAEQDLKEQGIYTLMASKSRVSWWIAKCVWCTVCVLLYFLLAWLTVAVYVLCSDSILSLSYTRDIGAMVNNGILLMSQRQVEITVLFLPPAIALGISMLQMLCSLIFGSVKTFMCVCSMYVLSVYYMHPLLLGNYTMWCRSKEIEKYSGMDMGIGFFLAALLFIGCILAGIFFIEKYDLMKDEADF